MSFELQHQSYRLLAGLIGLLLLHFTSRTVALLGLPIFIDESLHINWSLTIDFADEQERPRLIQGLSELQHVPIFVVLDNATEK